MSLLDLITGSVGNQVAEKAESKFGISKTQIFALLAVAAPLIISALRKNASKSEEDANTINQALDKDHDGSILSNIQDVENKTDEGSSILGHVFGTDKPSVENQLSEKTGIGMDKIGPLLGMLAPVVMGYIGQQKQANQVTSGGGLTDLLGGILNEAAPQQQASAGNPLLDLASQFLDKNKNGSMIDDLLGMFTKK